MPSVKRVWVAEDPSISKHKCVGEGCNRTAEVRHDLTGGDNVFLCYPHHVLYTGDRSPPPATRGTVKETWQGKGEGVDENQPTPIKDFSDLLSRDSEPKQPLRKDGFSTLLKMEDGETLELFPQTIERVAKNFRGESFSWVEDVLPLPYPNTLKIVALHAGKTRNQTEYVEAELKRVARTMVEKPVFYGKSHNPADKRVVGGVQWAEYEDGRLECVAVVEPEIYSLVKSGDIQTCSVETRYIYPEQVDGVRVHGVLFDGLLLVPKGVEVGDPDAEVTVNRLYETLNKGR